MPNHTFTTIEFQNEQDAQTVWDFATATPENGEENGGGFNFNNFIPMPEGVDWYSWSVDNWGTKWNAYDSDINGKYIFFTTAWSEPGPILDKIVQTFPNIEMDIYWYEEQGIEYVGEIYSDGAGHVWEYRGNNDLIAAAIYQKCDAGADVRYYDGMVFERYEFEDEEEYYTEDCGYPPFDEMEEIPEIANVAKQYGTQVA